MSTAPPEGPGQDGLAWFGGRLATGLVESSDDVAVLDRGGWWAVVLTFEGAARLYRFADVRPAPLPAAGPWRGPRAEEWTTSLDADGYRAGVRRIREHVRAGDVYQVNLCRVMSAPVEGTPGVLALAHRLARGNPAPYAGVLDVPGDRLVSASPELFLRRDGDVVTSAPIKGTAPTEDGLLPKDRAENVMITDLVRNDLQRVCRPGTVEVTSLLAVEQHPGLVHLVSTVQGRLTHGTGWADLLAATSPPGSVSGAPKSSALDVIAALEPVPRGPYCGGIGWVDADAGTGCLAVGIRTFWLDGGRLHFGTGAGITWDSDPDAEWEDPRRTAARLVALASGQDGGGPAMDDGPRQEEEQAWV